MRKQPIQRVAKLRDACYDKPTILQAYLAENPDRLPAEELAVVASWSHRITGEFAIVRYLKTYTVFMTMKEPTRLYGVLGLIDPLEVVLGGAPLPTLVKATLLRRFGIASTYDGVLNPYTPLRAGLPQQYQRDLQPA